jgi:hypothetical protein
MHMKVYFVKAEDRDFVNRDLIVVAETPRQAVDMMLKHFEIDEVQDFDRSPVVWTLPFTDEVGPRVINWEDLFATEVQP